MRRISPGEKLACIVFPLGEIRMCRMSPGEELACIVFSRGETRMCRISPWEKLACIVFSRGESGHSDREPIKLDGRLAPWAPLLNEHPSNLMGVWPRRPPRAAERMTDFNYVCDVPQTWSVEPRTHQT